MKLALERWGFRGSENVHVIADGDASRAGVMAALKWVQDNATDPRDAVVIYWSGHGSWAPDKDGDEALLDPSDKNDEALVPWDASNIHDPSQLILDDDIGKFLSSLKTTNVTLIVDACYSGTITRGAGPRPRGPLPPKDGGSGRVGMDPVDRPGNHVLLTASSAHQSSYEMQFGPDSTTDFGVFTYFLTEAMNRAEPNARYDDVWRDVAQLVRTNPESLGQSPQLEGVRSARLFQVNGDIAQLPFVTLSATGNDVHINAGAVHGIRKGAEFEVFPADEKNFRKDPLGRVVVNSVGTLESAVSTVSGGPFPAGARGILSRTPNGASSLQQLDVYIDPSAKNLTTDVAALPWIHVSPSTTAPVEITRVGGLLRILHRGTEVVPVDSAQVVRKTTRGSTGETVLSGFSDSAGLCDPLARAFAAEALTQIHNPAAPVSVEANLRLVPAGRRPTDRDPTIADTAVIHETYDLWAKIDAPAKSSFYLTVALEGLTSEPAMLYPQAGVANDPFELNQWVRIRRALTAQEPPGTEVLKAVVNSQQYDFSQLMSSFPKCDRGTAKGDKFTEESDAVSGWTSVEKRLVFVRKGGVR
jgi:hypothetical protein